MTDKVFLDTKPIGEIKGTFYVPNYQRGYRWSEPQVEALLNDIWDSFLRENKKYCLQPVVVRKRGDNIYELIDGQQRFTTILILLNFIKRQNLPIEIEYSLEYETRKNTSAFLSNINETDAQDNIDFFHICKADRCISDWVFHKFNGEKNKITNSLFKLMGYLLENVVVIWYEVGDDEDPIALFTRLNIGKIGLTNAELIRALLLNGKKADDPDKDKDQTEMSIQLDSMEKELRSGNDELWSFITKNDPGKYPTRIQIIYEMMVGITGQEIDPYETFNRFDRKIKDESVDIVWRAIQHDFLQIKDWYSDNEFYHKIGYLIASGYKTMPEIFNLARGKSKSLFRQQLNEFIAESINFKKIKDDETYRDLNYEDDKYEINRLLLLFNVESILRKGVYQRFPFSIYNNSTWSLEHIHAQQSEGLKSEKLWIEWIRLHIDSVKAVSLEGQNDELIEKMELIVKGDIKITRPVFDEIFNEVGLVLSEDTDSEYIHSLSNMALLSCNDNAALNNSAFDVKRNKIVEMDKEGAFIPYCTKMVFLKYYTASEDNQVHFWGKKDRESYLKAIEEILKPYIKLNNKTF